jgi:hypothetical protein
MALDGVDQQREEQEVLIPMNDLDCLYAILEPEK